MTQTTVTLDDGTRTRAAQALRRPDTTLAGLLAGGGLALEVASEEAWADLWSVETEFKYAGYLKRQQKAVERARRQEGRRIPGGFAYDRLPGLSREVAERLTEIRPETLGQALRVPGVTPAAVALIGARMAVGAPTGGRRQA